MECWEQNSDCNAVNKGWEVPRRLDISSIRDILVNYVLLVRDVGGRGDKMMFNVVGNASIFPPSSV